MRLGWKNQVEGIVEAFIRRDVGVDALTPRKYSLTTTPKQLNGLSPAALNRAQVRFTGDVRVTGDGRAIYSGRAQLGHTYASFPRPVFDADKSEAIQGVINLIR